MWQSTAPRGTAKLTGVFTVGAAAAFALPILTPPKLAAAAAPAKRKPSLRDSMAFLPNSRISLHEFDTLADHYCAVSVRKDRRPHRRARG